MHAEPRMSAGPSTATTDNRVEVAHLSVRYPRTARDALRDVSLELGASEVGLILGPSGSGKSTLGLALSGVVPRLIHADLTGTISLGAAPLDHGDSRSRGAVGTVFQDPESQFCTLTVRDEVAFGPENLRVPRAEIVGRVGQCLAAVGLGGFDYRNVYRLSGGQKQRLAVACVLALGPKAFFFDSPTANLDPDGALQLFETLQALKGRFPIFIVEQRLDDLIESVDRVVLLRGDGSVQAIDPPAQLFAPDRRDEVERTGVWVPEVIDAYWQLPASIRPSRPPLSVQAAAEMIRPYYRPQPGPHHQEPTQSTTNASIIVSDFSFRYPDGTVALDRVNMLVSQGGFHALVGQNGSGKSTLAHHLVGIRRPPAGSVALFGQDVAKLSLTSITRRVGFVFQNPEHQFVAPTVRDEIAYGLVRQGSAAAEIDRVVDEMLERFDLGSVEQANPFTLSAGQMRRLSVATVLAVGPDVLILDEPTFGQDRTSAERIMDLLSALNREGKTVVIVTHDMRLVADFATSVSVMNQGRVVFDGTPRELFARDSLLARTSLRPPPIWRLSALLAPDRTDDRALRLSELLGRINP